MYDAPRPVRDAKAHPIVHVLPSFTDVAFLLPVGLLFAGRGGIGSLAGVAFVSLAVIAVTFAVLYRMALGRSGRPLIAIAVTLLWTNLHGGFLAGILCIAAYAGGELVQAVVTADPGERRAAVRRSLPYLWALAASALASLGNPYTYHLHTHIYAYLNDPFTRQFVPAAYPGPCSPHSRARISGSSPTTNGATT